MNRSYNFYNPHKLFYTPVWKFDEKVPEGAYEWAIDYWKNNPNTIQEQISDYGSYKEKGRFKSNYNGYQSYSQSGLNNIPEEYQKFLQGVMCNFPGFNWGNWWMNIAHNERSSNGTHSHPNADLSIIWYLTDNHNLLIFFDPMQHSRSKLYRLSQGEWNFAGPMLSINCKAGDIIVFPSDLMHCVNAFEGYSGDPRICLSFNIVLNNPITEDTPQTPNGY